MASRYRPSGLGPPTSRVGEHMSKNHGSSGAASTVSSEHSAVTRDTTPIPSTSSRSFSASAVTMLVMSPIIFCTKAHASTVLGAFGPSFVTLSQGIRPPTTARRYFGMAMTGINEQSAAMRISDADRNGTLRRLHNAVALGLIDIDE